MALPGIFIAGVPATGKSWLGQWLAEKHGYIHIDAERDRGADLEGAGVRNEWNQLISTGRAGTFVKAIRRLPNPVIVNWGFPTRYLYVVSALQAEGLQAWWFMPNVIQHGWHMSRERESILRCSLILTPNG